MGLVPASWLESWVLKINLSWLRFFIYIFLNWFIYLFIYNFIIQYQVGQGLSFVIFFNFISKGLFWSYIPNHGFNRLTQVNLMVFFLLFFYIGCLFSRFVLQYWVVWDLIFELLFFIQFFSIDYLDLTTKSRIWLADLGGLELFFLVFIYFFNSIILHLIL